MREQIAELCHKQWSGWMEYLFSKCYPERGQFDKETGELVLVIPRWAVKRWKRQMNTQYEDLPEEEKETDRKEADRVLALLPPNTRYASRTEREDDMSTRIPFEIEAWEKVVYCPSCGKRLNREDYPEQVIDCPQCTTEFAVMNLATDQPPNTTISSGENKQRKDET